MALITIEDGTKFETLSDGVAYLGDGAYVKHYPTSEEVVLFTSDGAQYQNRVILGPREVATLVEFFKRKGFV